MKINLAKIEARLQALIEGGAARLFPTTQRKDDLAHLLVDAMRQGIRTSPEGELLAPNLYTLRVNPGEADLIQNDQAVLDGLTLILREAGGEAGLIFPSLPVLRIVEAPDLKQGEWQVIAQNSLDNLSDTTDIVIPPDEKQDAIPANAFLIVDGTQIFPLNQPVINIGRRLDNQLVIDDARISRIHAQLRAIRGRYVIFDLNSTGGTYVNGELIHQSALYPGDVISLSGVPLVFGQDAFGPGETQDYVPPSDRHGP